MSKRTDLAAVHAAFSATTQALIETYSRSGHGVTVKMEVRSPFDGCAAAMLTEEGNASVAVIEADPGGLVTVRLSDPERLRDPFAEALAEHGYLAPWLKGTRFTIQVVRRRRFRRTP